MNRRRKPQAMPDWRPGDLVWYYPSQAVRIRFAGVVASEPQLLGGHTWVVSLDPMSPEYTAQHPAKRTTVAAAACDALMKREVPVTDNEPVIHLKLPLTAGMMVALENLAALAMNDEVPFLEAEAKDVVKEGSSPHNKERVSELRALAAAYRAFHEGVSKAIVLDNPTNRMVGVKA